MKPLTLEGEMVAIEDLDSLRVQAYRLRNHGIEQLRNVELDPTTEQAKLLWADPHDEPQDFIKPAILFHLSTRDFARQQSRQNQKRHVEFLQKFRESLLKLKVTDLFDIGPRQATIGGPATTVPIFQAARVLLALSSSPDTFFSSPAMCSYYRVVRELYSVDAPNWFIGGARATTGGMPTAFVTGECTRGIASMARALDKTAQLLLVALRTHESLAETRAASLPDDWKSIEVRRAILSAYVVLSDIAGRSFVTFDGDDIDSLLSGSQDFDAFLKFMALLGKRALETADAAHVGIREARQQIDFYRAAESTGSSQLPAIAKHRHELSHNTGLAAIRRAEALAEEGKRAAASLAKFDATHGADKNDPDRRIVEDYIRKLQVQADSVRQLFAPAKEYIEAVLDREVEKGTSRHLNVGELAFAAASYAAMQRPGHDSRLVKAKTLLSDALSEDGTLSRSGYLDTDFHGRSLILLGSEVLRAMAQVYEFAPDDIHPDVVRKMLSYFETTAVHSASGEHPEGPPRVAGWTHDQPRHPRRAYRWTSALAIVALDRIGRMLDAKINREVQRHFTTTSAEELRLLSPHLTLSRLCYADYDLAASKPSVVPAENRGQSVAFFLERMRAHILGVKRIPGYDGRCHSLILFGPPGTGKTTLVEALARSAYADLIEITPSDFLVEGEDFVERRARVVLKALSFLTKSVILFDEFEQILRTREDSTTERSVFSFLTPGMLPKLKKLNTEARNRQVAYCLITNHIGSLDNAAIRSGRFDHKVGVYPPDLLSRIGLVLRAANECEKTWKKPPIPGAVASIVNKTRDQPMERMASPGNFVSVENVEDLNKNSMLAEIFKLNGSVPYEPGPPDADWKKFDRRFKNIEDKSPHEIAEHDQWKWVRARDDGFAAALKGVARGAVDVIALYKQAKQGGTVDHKNDRPARKRRR